LSARLPPLISPSASYGQVCSTCGQRFQNEPEGVTNITESYLRVRRKSRCPCRQRWSARRPGGWPGVLRDPDFVFR